jgi:hypothetical protein
VSFLALVSLPCGAHAASDRKDAGTRRDEGARITDPEAHRLAVSYSVFVATLTDRTENDASKAEFEGDAFGFALELHYERMLPLEHFGVVASTRYAWITTDRRSAEGQGARRSLELGVGPLLRLPRFGRKSLFELSFSVPFALGVSLGSDEAPRSRVRETTRSALSYGFGLNGSIAVAAPRAAVLPFVGFEIAHRLATQRVEYTDLEEPNRSVATSERWSLLTIGVLAGVGF